MTADPLIALMHGSLLALGTTGDAVDPERRVGAIALVHEMRGRIARALAGPGSDRREATFHHGTGHDLRIHGFHFPGPRGGRAAVVRIVAPPEWAGGSAFALDLAARALDALLDPAWRPSDKAHARAVATACAVAAARAAPRAQMWLGDAGGPLGTQRADALSHDRVPGWEATGGLDGLAPAATLPTLTVAIDKPRERGRVPHAVTLEPAWARLTPQALAAIDPVAMLRLMALVPPTAP